MLTMFMILSFTR